MQSDPIQNELTQTLPTVKSIASDAKAVMDFGVPPDMLVWIVVVVCMGNTAMKILDRIVEAIIGHLPKAPPPKPPA